MSKHSEDFLVELGCAELPPKALKSLSDAFQSGVEAGLGKAGLSYQQIQSFASPRRLAILISSLDVQQDDIHQERWGPAVKAAFDKDGNPTPAANGFARSCGVSVDDLDRADNKGIEKLFFKSVQPGSGTAELLPSIISGALNKLPIPRKMRWGSTRDEFVRPVYWLIMLFGQQVIDTELFGIRSGRTSWGHRFHGKQQLDISAPAEYEHILETDGYVIANYQRRKEVVSSQVAAQGNTVSGTVFMDPDLLDEVTSMVEWPVALTGRFDDHFLNVPAEALISSMKSHQKTFYITGDDGKLMPYFVAVANLESKDPAQVIAGNERVIRPRLADAAFFYESDRKAPLSSRIEQLEKIVFQQQLGTVADKSRRVAQLSAILAEKLNGDRDNCERAALLAKCDLVTHMVAEFPELQGIMGYYYANHDGEANDVARAINEQYLPRFSGDTLPETLTGAILAIAEKLDTMAGMFAIGQPPSGSKDPFALRRSALGILRILVEKNLDLDLNDAIRSSLALYQQQGLEIADGTGTQIFNFLLDRFRAWYQAEGVSSEVFQAVYLLQPGSPMDFAMRIEAVKRFVNLPESEALAAANKRVSNILQKTDSVEHAGVDTSLFEESAESALWQRICDVRDQTSPLFENRNYTAAMESLAVLRPEVDSFFDNVMVMADNDQVRNNRLSMLSELRSLFLRGADISCLHQS